MDAEHFAFFVENRLILTSAQRLDRHVAVGPAGRPSHPAGPRALAQYRTTTAAERRWPAV